MKIKIICLLIILVILPGFLVLGAQVTFPVEGGAVLFDTVSKSVTGFMGQPTNVVIPNEISGVAVENISNSAFYRCADLVTVSLPETVTSIGDSAFWACDSLESINIPKGITEIKQYTFAECRLLPEIEIPNGVYKIGEGAFSNCHALKSVVLPDSLTFMGKYVFNNCEKLTFVIIPVGVTVISEYVFNNCRGMRSVIIPDGVVTIDNGAFNMCAGLSEVRIPGSVTKLGEYAFNWCIDLTSAVISANVINIGSDAFLDCNKLTVYGYSGSAIEAYTAINQIPFEDAVLSAEPALDISHKRKENGYDINVAVTNYTGLDIKDKILAAGIYDNEKLVGIAVDSFYVYDLFKETKKFVIDLPSMETSGDKLILKIFLWSNELQPLITENLQNMPEDNEITVEPRISEIYNVDRDIIAVKILQGNYIPHTYVPYKARQGDIILRDYNEGVLTSKILKRAGEKIAYIVGENENFMFTFDDYFGEELNQANANALANYTLVDNMGNEHNPILIHQKTKVTDSAHSNNSHRSFEHVFYLKFANPLVENEKYTLKFSDLNLNKDKVSYVFSSDKVRSEAIHVSQIGYRPDDRVKRAYLSLWKGTGGAHSYNTPDFHIIDTDTKEIVHSGTAVFRMGEWGWGALSGGRNNQAKTDVYYLDFGQLVTPGSYIISVEGVGTSYPFSIADDVWEKAFLLSMKGFYNMRGSVELRQPYTEYVRPAETNTTAYQSTARLVDTTNGLNAKGISEHNFDILLEGRTDELVPEAIGGYHDAGDWDRRVSHLEATSWQLDLLEDFPQKAEMIDLNIPKEAEGLPDILNEAIFAVQMYYDLQLENGAIRGGFEYEGHPADGEVSWMNSMDAFVYAPDCYSCYYYIITVAKLASLLYKYKPELADQYRDSAIEAMEWAEIDYLETISDPLVKGEEEPYREDPKFKLRDLRNAAAAELYALTSDEEWHDIFKEDTVFKTAEQDKRPMTNFGSVYGSYDQLSAAYRYARLPDGMADLSIKANAKNAILYQAQLQMTYIDDNAYNLGFFFNEYVPLMIGFYSAPQPMQLAYAYVLTGNENYLDYLEKACLFSAGANPMNMTFTTGLGIKYVKNPFHIDSKMTAQKPPVGLTVYGTWDLQWPWSVHWADQYIYNLNVPWVNNWPNNEGFFDAYGVAMTEEWTPNQTVGRSAYAWGVLALR